MLPVYDPNATNHRKHSAQSGAAASPSGVGDDQGFGSGGQTDVTPLSSGLSDNAAIWPTAVVGDVYTADQASPANGYPEAKQSTTGSGGAATLSASTAVPASVTYGTSGGLQIIVDYDASVGTAPAAFQTAIATAAQYFVGTFANPITITIGVGWGEVDGQPLSSGALGESLSYLAEVGYSQLAGAFAAGAVSADQKTAAASLPATNPTGGNLWTTTAEAKALSLLTGYTGTDGYVGFGSGYSWDFTDAPPSAGQYDFIAVAEHEISEVLGRQALLGATIGSTPNSYSALDLFRYSATGQRSLVGGQTAYLSFNGGQTNLDYFNTVSGGDWGDWSSSGTTSAGQDAYNAFAGSGALYAVSSSDTRELNVLGYALTTGAPVVTERLVDDTGASSTDRITNDPAVAGTADPNATVVVSQAGTVLGSATADGSGNWSFAPVGLGDGVHTLTASETNSAGSTGSATLTFTLDTTPPAVTEALTYDTGVSASDLITSKATVHGTGDPNAKVAISEHGSVLGTATASSSGAWSFTPTGLANGVHTFVASETDLAGNTGSASLTFTFDTVAPKVTEKLLSDTGYSSTDRITLNPAVTGTGDPNTPVKISQGGIVIGTTTSDASGNWAFAPTGLADGSHTLVASATDIAGNTGTASLAFTLDTTPPTPPPAPLLGSTLGAGAPTSSNVLATAAPSFTGTTEAYASVYLYDGTTLIGGARANAQGVWAITSQAGLATGTHALTVTATDVAGNVSAASSATSVTALSSTTASFSYGDNNINLEIGNQNATASFGNGAVFVKAGSGSDTFVLGGGNDTLVLGGGTSATDNVTLGNGNDTVSLTAGKYNVTAGTGADEFIFGSPQGELILDLASNDELVFRNSAFNLGIDNGRGTATPQLIDPSLFSSNTDGTFATTANRFAYDQSTGHLLYDQYGSASPGSATLVANLTNLPALAASKLFFTS